MSALADAVLSLSDGIGINDVFVFAAGATAVLTFLMVWVIRPLRRMTRTIDRFLDEWNGVPAFPGHDAVPGVPERLRSIEQEVQRNGGSSLKDRVFEIDRKLDALTQAKQIEHREIRESVDRLRAAVQSDDLQCQVVKRRGSKADYQDDGR